MEHAIDAVKSGAQGLNEASRNYNVPRSTLRDRITGRVVHGCKPGPTLYLSTAEEKELVDFFEECIIHWTWKN